MKLCCGKGTVTTGVVEEVDNLWDIVGQPKYCQAMVRETKDRIECSSEVAYLYVENLVLNGFEV